MSQSGWIGCDLDGTLAHYDGWKGPEHIGEPIPAMVAKVKVWLALGEDVRIFTARIFGGEVSVLQSIQEWCVKHIGQSLPVTCAKDYGMISLYDDRAVQIVENTGLTLEESKELTDPLRSIEFDPSKQYLLLVDKAQIGEWDIVGALMNRPFDGAVVMVVPFRRIGDGEPVVVMEGLKAIRQWLEAQEAKAA